ncbi:MAG: hypothetical protein ACI4OL_01860 [Gemmiger sp.]
MAQTAYDLNTRPASRREPQVRVVRGGRSRLDGVKNTLRTVRTVLVTALILGLIASLVYSQAQITMLTGEVESARSELTAAQSTYGYLSSTMDSITSRANIEEAAQGSLGLVKADATQYTYLCLESESVITRTTSGATRLFQGFRSAALSLLGNLDP